MSVVLTTHIEPGYSSNDPMANQNLFFQHTSTGDEIYSGNDLKAGEQYWLKLNVLNEGDSEDRRMHYAFYYSENPASSYDDLTQIGTTSHQRISSGQTLTVQANQPFIPSDGKFYEFYGVVYCSSNAPNCSEPTTPDPESRQVAGQTASVGAVDVQLTLHEGLDQNGSSIGQNPNFYLESSGNEYLLKARVVNNGTSTDRVQVVFYAKDKGTNNPIATSEIASVQGNGGEYVFTSMEKWSYEHGDNELMAVCSTISEADQYSSKNFNPSDRHVAQTNLHSANS